MCDTYKNNHNNTEQQQRQQKETRKQTNKTRFYFLVLEIGNHFSGSWEVYTMRAYAIIPTIRSILCRIFTS